MKLLFGTVASIIGKFDQKEHNQELRRIKYRLTDLKLNEKFAIFFFQSAAAAAAKNI